MNKPTIILLLILTIVSCGKKTELPINESQFQNKTFSLLFESENDTLIIEFQDSTHQVFGNLREGKIPWRISHFNNTNLLVLDNRVIGIKKTDIDKFDCTYIGLKDNPFTMVERKNKWNKELIYGTRVKKEYEKYFDNSLNDSIPKPPPPLAPKGISESDYNFPGFYEITKDSIKFYESYSIYKSAFEINNTNEYLLMHLGNEFDKGENRQWNIKKLSDKEMVVNREVYELSSIKYITDTLIKKR